MKKRILLAGAIIIVVLAVVSVSARGGQSNSSGRSSIEGKATPPIASSVGAPNIMSEPYSKADSGLRTDSGASSSGATPTTGAVAQDQSSIMDRMIVYTANLSIVVKDVQETLSSVGELTSRLGGSVVGTSTSYKDSKMFATATIKVPSLAYNDAMDGLRRLGLRVESENSSGREVTEEYTDLQSQLRNLEATESQYLALMKKAQTIDEILKVQGKLTETRGQIERVKGRMNYLQKSSDMATITVSIMPEGVSKVAYVPSEWDPARAANEAWEASLGILRGAATVAIRVAVFSWWLVPPTLLLLLAATRLRTSPSA